MIRFLIYLFLVSFPIHFLWEVTQMPAYGTLTSLGDMTDVATFIKIHWIVSLKDAALTVILYLAVAVAVRNGYWGRHLSRRRLAALTALGVLGAAALEYYHVFVAGNWTYGPAMPLLPIIHLGLWPVLQMVIVPLTAMVLVRRQLFS